MGIGILEKLNLFVVEQIRMMKLSNLKLTLREAAIAAIGVIAGSYGIPAEKVQAIISSVLSLVQSQN